MDLAIARSVLERELNALRALGYRGLRELIGADIARQVTGPDGVPYQLRILVLWDGDENGAIRVIGSIDDGGLRTFIKPLQMDDLIQPEP